MDDNTLSMSGAIRAAINDGNGGRPELMGALALAFIGDTVCDLYVRTHLVSTSTATPKAMHRAASSLVCAKAQAQAFRRIEGMLDETELAVFKRGRNAHMGTVPKHAEIADYRVATGFEALVGYLYMSGLDERLAELMSAAVFP